MIDLITLDNQKNLIDGVVLHQLKINRDQSGILSEVLKTNWNDIFGITSYPFAQCYYSVTPSGGIRDKDLWHVHPTKQEDRFVIIRGEAIVAIYDSRKDSKTCGRLNLFQMGQENGDNNQFLLLIPKNTLHGFAVVSKNDVVLLNFPTSLYDVNEEGRISHKEASAKFSDGSIFSWERVLEEFK
ncbi:MAG: dTDP-4-dehydrorhamnose 3,5-epimerase family protein [Patescibacteria group bacterium]|nr:dTDP-4-dehydrorhamnose 3,5-epimerase family protein [Patescibacteria group bacterium]